MLERDTPVIIGKGGGFLKSGKSGKRLGAAYATHEPSMLTGPVIGMSDHVHPTPTPSRALLLFLMSGVLAGFFVVWTSLAVGPDAALSDFDKQCANYWREHGIGRAWAFIVFLTDLGSIATMGMVAIMGALWQSSHRRRFFGAAWFAIVVGGGLADMTLKTALDRDRPPVPDRAVLESNKSYPSGHAMGSSVGYGMLCYALLRQTRFPFRRTVIALFFVVLVSGIGFSRIYLRAHWFSDVIAGYIIGLCWLSFWVAWLERRRLRRAGIEADHTHQSTMSRRGP
jgi:undecaprenyl-diphosphatase